MCKLCDTPDLLARMERVVKALDAGSSVSPSALRDLIADAHDMLGIHFRAQLAQRLLMSGSASVEILNADDLQAPPGGLH
ncbi:hypothetical protein [Microcystis phage Mae-JY30]